MSCSVNTIRGCLDVSGLAGPLQLVHIGIRRRLSEQPRVDGQGTTVMRRVVRDPAKDDGARLTSHNWSVGKWLTPFGGRPRIHELACLLH